LWNLFGSFTELFICFQLGLVISIAKQCNGAFSVTATEEIGFHLPLALAASGYSLQSKGPLMCVSIGKGSEDEEQGTLIREGTTRLSLSFSFADMTEANKEIASLSLRDQALVNLSQVLGNTLFGFVVLGIW